MKKMIAVMMLGALLAVLATGCATPVPFGMLYTEVKMPVGGSGPVPEDLKVGTSECKSFLGVFASGDASITAAKRSAGITEISYVDWEVENILGFVGKYKCVVYGK